MEAVEIGVRAVGVAGEQGMLGLCVEGGGRDGENEDDGFASVRVRVRPHLGTTRLGRVSQDSACDLLVLHAVRLKGMADDDEVVARFGLDRAEVSELLLDFQAYGWITRVDFAGTGGWTLTEAGKRRNEQQLAQELTTAGARTQVESVHRDFLPLNARLLRAGTDWQLRPTATDPLAANKHDDPNWDARVLGVFDVLARALGELEPRLTACLGRFAGYHDRFSRALERVHGGDLSWVTKVREDSCHTAWMELHEDLVATLGIERGAG